MGLTDWFNDVTDALTGAAKAALETTRRLADKAKQELDRTVHKAEQIADSATADVYKEANGIESELMKAVPTFEGKLQDIIDEITKAASNAADAGVDINKSINGAVEIVFVQIEEALKAAVDAVNRLVKEAENRLSQMLKGILPGFFERLLSPIKSLIDVIRTGLNKLAKKLRDGVSAAIQTIRSTVQGIVRKISEALGPVWEYVKKLWKLFFGTEPEQCSLTAQWFDERIRRTEKQFLSKSLEQPMKTLIRRRTFLELVPPDDDAWRAIVLEFLNRADTSPAWATCAARLGSVLSSTSPHVGTLVQITLDEPFVDRLGGNQQIQVSILYYRWKTAEFRKVSSGFLGILALITAVGKQDTTSDRLSTQTTHQPTHQPTLEIDEAMSRKIYSIIEPHLLLGKPRPDQETRLAQDKKTHVSLQSKSREGDGVWRDTGEAKAFNASHRSD